MKIGDWTSTADLNDLYRQIRDLGLEPNLAELDAFGFTVIENALTPDQVARCRDAVLRTGERKFQRKLDLENEVDHEGWLPLLFLLKEDRVFEEVILGERTLALATYMLGRSCILGGVASHVKGPGGPEIPLHHDTGNGLLTPLDHYSHLININYALTDYTEEAGALAMVPGSHRFCRQPLPSETKLSGNERNPHAIPIEAPAGTAILWHGNTWHGSFPRKQPGLRINLATYFARQYLTVQEDYSDFAPEIISRHGPDSRMARLLGSHLTYPWKEEGLEGKRRPTAGDSWHS